MAIDLPRERMSIIALAAKARLIRPRRPHTSSTETVTDVSGQWSSQWPLDHWHRQRPPIDDVVLLCCCLSVCCNTGNKYLNLNGRKGTVLCSYVGIRLFWKELPSIAIMVCQMQLMNHHSCDVMVEAVNYHWLHPASILDLYKVFENLHMLRMGIRMHPYTVIPVQVMAKFWETGVQWIPYDIVVSWLRL